MIRGNFLIENISKLNTFILMSKSNESLELYINKILNKNCKSLKFINDYDYISLDLLYTSLQIMNTSEITSKEFNKIDKKELKYYMSKTKGISYFKSIVPAIKNEEILVNYLKKALANGEYICNHNNTVKFDNGLIVDSNWLIEFAHFLITSFNINENLSFDSKTYSFKTIEISNKPQNIKDFIKDIKLYEYNVTRKDGKILSFQNVEYLINVLSNIEKYDFKSLQEINSILSKEQYYLSINKLNANFNKDNKTIIEKYLNEDSDNVEELNEYIKDLYKCNNSKTKKNKRKLIKIFEILRSLSHAYKNNYSLNECRKLFDLNSMKEEIRNAIAISNFFINYIYDQTNLLKHFNYELLITDEIKPSIIDYDTNEYKSILSELSSLNKRVVLENRKINRLLEKSKNEKTIEETQEIEKTSLLISRLMEEVNDLQEQLSHLKDVNRKKANINKQKIKYIKEAISSGQYNYDSSSKTLTFDCFNDKDYHKTFHLEITLDEFITALLNNHNKNARINFYQL